MISITGQRMDSFLRNVVRNTKHTTKELQGCSKWKPKAKPLSPSGLKPTFWKNTMTKWNSVPKDSTKRYWNNPSFPTNTCSRPDRPNPRPTKDSGPETTPFTPTNKPKEDSLTFTASRKSFQTAFIPELYPLLSPLGLLQRWKWWIQIIPGAWKRSMSCALKGRCMKRPWLMYASKSRMRSKVSSSNYLITLPRGKWLSPSHLP